MKERDYGLELEQEIKKLEEEVVKANIQKESRIHTLKSDLGKLDENYSVSYDIITKELFSMIPIEQLICHEINKKNSSLEELIQKITDYLVTLDQLYFAITKGILISVI